MTREAALHAYKKGLPVRIGKPWRDGGELVYIVRVTKGDGGSEWFRVRLPRGGERDYGHEQLHSLEGWL